MGERDERRARNEAAFRDANEEIRAAQRRLGLPETRLPFICECDDVTCRTVIRLTPAEYERARGSAIRFVVAEGHAEPAAVVDEGDGYRVVEKGGDAADVARATDPRRPGAGGVEGRA